MKLVKNISEITIMANEKANGVGAEFKVSNEVYENIKDFVELVEDIKDEVDLNSLTKAELKAMLDEKGIDYDSKATNPELIALLEDNEEE